MQEIESILKKDDICNLEKVSCLVLSLLFGKIKALISFSNHIRNTASMSTPSTFFIWIPNEAVIRTHIPSKRKTEFSIAFLIRSPIHIWILVKILRFSERIISEFNTLQYYLQTESKSSWISKWQPFPLLSLMMIGMRRLACHKSDKSGFFSIKSVESSNLSLYIDWSICQVEPPQNFFKWVKSE